MLYSDPHGTSAARNSVFLIIMKLKVLRWELGFGISAVIEFVHAVGIRIDIVVPLNLPTW